MTEERGEEGAGVYGRPPTLSVCTAAILPMLFESTAAPESQVSLPDFLA